MTTQTPGFYLLNHTYQLISNQMLFIIGYFVRFGGVLQSYTHQIEIGYFVNIDGSYTQLD
tara:strand:- start:26 stop:205 length:180 start_codon:yes stop_codon:yes gene_type:complete